MVQLGAARYPTATRLLITADCGGSNGVRLRLWKRELQVLADELRISITVCHLPPGTSKWNRIEHRLFAFITQNWRGKPLVSHQVIIQLIANTTTDTGLTVACRLDDTTYEKGIKVSDAEMASLNIQPANFHGDWNILRPEAARRMMQLSGLRPLGAIAYVMTAAISIVAAAIMKFAVLPNVETFPAFCAVIGLYLITVGFAAARTRSPALTAVFGGIAVVSIRLIAPTNPMTYDTGQFYNAALAAFVGSAIGALAFRLMPPLSPAVRAWRLLALALRDLRRLAISPPPRRSADWERRMYDRLAALPDEAEPLQPARLLAALSVGTGISHLCHLVSHLGAATEFDAALASLAQANSTAAIARLHLIDRRLAFDPDTRPETDDALRVRGRIIAISEVLAEHGSYFDSGAPA